MSSSIPNFSSEYLQSEIPAVKILEQLGYEYLDGLVLERNIASVLLEDDFKKSLVKLNPWISEDNLGQVVKILTTPKNTDLILINQEIRTYYVKGVSILQDIGKGKKNQTVRLFDYDNPSNNRYKVVRQFRVKMSESIGIYEKNIPDIVVFINWIPISVIECKAPTVENALKKGIDQLVRYQKEIPKLFWYTNTLISCAGTSGLMYGTTETSASYYAFWKTYYPYENEESAKQFVKNIDSPTPQDYCLLSMFEKSNVLDIIQNFTVFENENQKILKKVCRRQQFQAVKKMAKRLELRDEDGGVIWHTQWSGKSLTMVYAALKVKRLASLENPTIVIVTDRNNLDNQISGTFQNAGFENPIQIKAEWSSKTKNLIKELSSSDGKTILTTIQSFQSDWDYPLLSDRKNIVVFVDEAHRSQFGLGITNGWKLGYAGNMRKALPNAFFVAFTGTPIEKDGIKNVRKVFGTYIDSYKISDAVADGATVPIKYELRYAVQDIDQTNFDDDYNFIMWGLSQEDQQAIKEKYGTTKDIMEAPERIKAITKDIIKHYNERISPNGYKGMIVACSRQACITYKKYLDEFNGPESVVIISGDNDDSEDLKRAHLTKEQEERYVGKGGSYHNPNSWPYILIVNEKLLTGFDAPLCQVMYLDNYLKEHTLLQAIARTNRTCTIERGGEKLKKTYGLIVDYVGIGSYLTQALEMYDKADIDMDDILTTQSKDILKLKEQMFEIRELFAEKGLSWKSELEDYLSAMEDEAYRKRFKEERKKSNEIIDELLPNNQIIGQYGEEIKKLAILNNAMRERFREQKNSYLIDEMGAKVKKLIDEYVRSYGVKVILTEVDILDIDFKNRIKNFGTDKAKASEMRNQLKNVINTKVGVENPTLAEKLSEKLQRIITQVHDGVMDIAKELEEYYLIRDEILASEEEKKQYQMDNLTHAIYTYLKDFSIADITAVKDLRDGLRPLCIVDWMYKNDAIKDITAYLKRKLYGLGFEDVNEREVAINQILLTMKGQYGN